MVDTVYVKYVEVDHNVGELAVVSPRSQGTPHSGAVVLPCSKEPSWCSPTRARDEMRNSIGKTPMEAQVVQS